jgi:uracil phosphoribosyltransferase
MLERAYDAGTYRRSEADHEYGDTVHILADPLALGLLARLCHPDTTQPDFNRLIRELYRQLLAVVLNAEFPRVVVESPTRMQAATERGVFRGAVLDPATDVVVVDVARAGIVPGMVCFDYCSDVFEPSRVRQDHVVMSRTTDANGTVTGATIVGDKVGGSIDGRYVLFPDPMGATGSSLAEAIDYYKANHGNAPTRIITMNLINTPEFIQTMQDRHPEVVMYTLRLDRGMSDASVLQSRLGAHRANESGLSEVDYIVPGGGGFGELMNNSWV